MIGMQIVVKGCYIISCIYLLTILSSVHSTYNFPIAGNRSIAECINGKRPEHWNTEMYITTTELARQLGYTAEEHFVLTEDGYILTLHRIKGVNATSPVFLQHGLFGSSFHYVVSGKNKALALILADKGYDVWLANGRGSTYSLCHTHYTTSDSEYWNFSWHEMGTFDLAAEITYVTNVTKQNVIFVGVSLGATISYVMAIERPNITSKVKAIFGIAPIVYFEYAPKLIKLLARFVRLFQIFGKITRGELRPPSKLFVKYFCSLTLIQRKICATFGGFDYHQVNYTLLPTMLYHLSSGSFKTFYHYSQNINANKFQHYDYGEKENLSIYNSTKPPIYDIAKINVPVGIFRCPNDILVRRKDAQRFYDQLPIKILNYEIKNPTFNHIDSVLANEAAKYIFSKLLSVMENYK